MGVYQKFEGGDWYIDYYVNGRRKRECIGPNKRQADQILAKRRVQIAEGRYLDVIRDEKIRFKDFAQVYLQNHAKLNKRSWYNDEYRIERLNKWFGGLYLGQITPLDIEKYKAERLQETHRGKKISPATVNRELALIKVIFSKAIQWGKFNRENPVKKVKNFRENNERLRYLSKEEIAKLLEHCGGELNALVKFALNTGMRRGEIMALTWNDVDIHNRIIYIRNSKSGASRQVPMNSGAKDVLLSLRKGSDNSNVFSSNYRSQFECAIRRSQIKGASFHTLRHTAASHLAMAGVDLLTISRILGHSNVKMTMRYAHLSPDFMANAMQRLDTIWTPKAILSGQQDTIKKLQVYVNKHDAGMAKLADAQDLKS